MIVLILVNPARMNSSRNAVSKRNDRERDRNQHRDERAEDEQQHDDRRKQAEGFRGPLLDGRKLRVAVELDRHPRGLDGLPDGVLDRENGLAILVLDRLIELRLRVRDAPAVGEVGVVERVADLVSPAVPSEGLNSDD